MWGMLYTSNRMGHAVHNQQNGACCPQSTEWPGHAVNKQQNQRQIIDNKAEVTGYQACQDTVEPFISVIFTRAVSNANIKGAKISTPTHIMY
jgi:hypothetical protein